MPRRRCTHCLAAVVAVFVAACATTPARRTAGPPTTTEGAYERLIEMPPLELKIRPDGSFETRSADELFEAGNAAYDEGQWEVAVLNYDYLVHHFADDPLVPAALYNAGLALEQLGRFGDAERYFAALIDRYPEHELVTNALWNLLEFRERREAWIEVLDTIAVLRHRVGKPSERFELDVREAIARAVLEPSDESLDQLENLALAYSRRLREGEPLPRDTFARIYWTIGEIHLGRSQAVIVDPDAPNLEEALERKARELLSAQEAYMRTIRALDPYWATRAVFRIGFAYESFYADLVTAPVPSSLRGEERRVYLEEVRKVLEPVRRKAQIAYERLIVFSKRFGIDTEWVERARERLAKLKALVARQGEVSPPVQPTPTTDPGR